MDSFLCYLTSVWRTQNFLFIHFFFNFVDSWYQLNKADFHFFSTVSVLMSLKPLQCEKIWIITTESVWIKEDIMGKKSKRQRRKGMEKMDNYNSTILNIHEIFFKNVCKPQTVLFHHSLLHPIVYVHRDHCSSVRLRLAMWPLYISCRLRAKPQDCICWHV